MTRSRDISKGATRQEFVYTATSQQTTFSGNDDSSNSLSYTAGQIDVFVNGVRQAAADYTATNGTSVVLGAGASAGDTVNINAFGSFSVADVIVARAEFDYTATAGQTTFTGSDNDSQTMAYTAGRIDVYLNGSRLNVTDDYVATNGTSVVLEAGAQAGDSLVVVSHGTVNLAANIVAGDLDLNGNELILDVDGDTSITADTDDQIDIKIAGADDFRFTANSFNALSGSTLTVDSGATITNSGTANGFGKILQVVSTTKTDTFSTSTVNSFVDITGLSVAITPRATSSKILVLYDLQMSGNEIFFIQLVRASTAIKVGDSDSANRKECTVGGFFQASNNDKVAPVAGSFLDSPSTTSETTYKIQGQVYDSGNSFSVNRTINDSNAAYSGRGASTITVMEVEG